MKDKVMLENYFSYLDLIYFYIVALKISNKHLFVNSGNLVLGSFI